MAKQRTDRLNSLLKEVIFEVIRRDVHDPLVTDMVVVTRVDISKDLHHAKVYVSVLGTDLEKKSCVEALQKAAGFIGVIASKKIVIRFFPALRFFLDDTVDKQMKIEELLQKIRKEEEARPQGEGASESA
jgi:ribosome-binding factor A